MWFEITDRHGFAVAVVWLPGDDEPWPAMMSCETAMVAPTILTP
ncbi:hypothetical protein [Sphingomonas qomolangmaensis]|uniref:Uncharacterized protein n=1 Tax=Sphingomonas qomolangmaensis TaxID=2918765 RepID=A0ABY5L7Z8_9SPHN|nr:hypothetical protein [Sphingomonas qomolangmaensis]UUL82567.1 hypothetical protein NMP03_15575 [Sphingomonas qomolangmaensis]